MIKIEIKSKMDFLPFVWPYTTYKFGEYYKKFFNESVDAQTSLGPIKGLKQTSQYGYEYVEFRGIPYAKPPIGVLRFKDPEPAEPWIEPLVTVNDRACCHRDIIFRRPAGTEDCLHINVYTKNLNPSIPAPVMVFIHGGAFIYGSNGKDLFNPEYLLQKDIVLILVNYRLGAFGFLSLDDPALGIPGNAGMKDQVLALKWVQQNAFNFGGDPNNVTLFGESAGGCSVHYHMLSEMSKGLFHKAVSMSGTALCSWSVGLINDAPERMAKFLGWNGEGGYKRILEILREASVDDLLKAQEALVTLQERKKFVTFPFAPLIEPYRSKQCFLPKNPVQMTRDAWSHHIPLMIGGCSGEGLFIYKITKNNQQFLTKLNGFFENVIPSKLEVDKSSEKCKQLGAAVKRQYFGNENVSFNVVFKYLDMLGDIWFWHGIYNTVSSRLLNQKEENTYLYRFDFDSKIQNHSKFMFAGRDVAGACHADDCSYLFKNAITLNVNKNSRETKTVKRMVELWTSFAATGKPASDDCDKWYPVQQSKPYKCLNISDKLEFIDLPETERMEFWDSLYRGVNVDMY